MEIEDQVAIAAARTDSMAAGTVAVAGVVALCNELGASQMLDDQQLNRIRASMLLAVQRSAATEMLQLHLKDAIGLHFAELRKRMS